MNLLSQIIERLNQRIGAGNIFDQIYGLSELSADGNDKAWVHYIGNGQAVPVTNFDAHQATIFWAKRGKITVQKVDSIKLSGCKALYETKFTLSAYAVARKSHLPCDAADAQDWLASRVLRLVSGTDPLFKTSIGVVSYEVIPNGYANEVKSLTANYEFACVTIDVDVNVISPSEDGCYDTCGSGDIPLPDLIPCTPCLTEVAVDGITIIGNGTEADPLVAIGGGGGVGTLQQVTNLGNSTTNDIQLINNAEVIFGAGGGVLLDNASRLREGTIDAGLGGSKGIAQICAVGYELKWEAGRLYVMDGNGTGIRWSLYNFTITPTVNDDSTKGYAIGSRWTLDDGSEYLCSDATIGAAVWAVVSTGGVTNVTATSPIFSSGGATPDISIQPANLFDDGYLTSADFTSFFNKFDTPTGTNADYLDGTGTPTLFPTLTNGTVTSVAATVPTPTNPAFSVNVPNNTTTPSVDITANGVVSQYVRGDGSLANFPLGGGGGASVNYYLNGSISQGTIGGNQYFEMSRVPVLGGGTNFTRTNAQGNGYIAQFLTDAGDPNLLAIPSGNWNFETYFNASSGGGNPSFYIELYKYDGATFTLISSGATNPEAITGGTVVDLYVSALAVPSTVLLATDRLAVRIFVTPSGRNITLHTEDNNLCQVITTFTTGLNALNGLTAQVQNFATDTSGTDFGITSATDTHTFNLPTASASNRGALSSGDWTTFNGKFNTPSGTTAQYVRGDGSLATFPSLPLIYKDVNNQTAVTGNTNNNKVVSVLIPANTITVGAIVEIKARVGKTGGAGVTTLRVYANTADSIVTPAPTLIITSATSAIGNIYNGMDRSAIVKSATVTQTAQANASIQTDAVVGNATLTNSNIDWTVNQYLIFAIQNGSAADSTVLSYYQIEIK